MSKMWPGTAALAVAVSLASGAQAQQYKLVGANDLGMHCMDKEYSVFSILPPFNVTNVQVVRYASGATTLLDASTVKVTYQAVADATGSINSTSLGGKTQFWTYVFPLFHFPIPAGMGLGGLYMPADAPVPGPQPLAYEAASRSFRAFGIPITPIDDANHVNPYPLMRFVARSVATNALLAQLDVVVPVAEETDCQGCHVTGQIAATDPNVAWSNDPDLEVQAKRNILTLHDLHQGTQLSISQPVLCARCHYSPPLDLFGTGSSGLTQGVTTGSTRAQRTGPHTPGHLSQPKKMSEVMHEHHGSLVDGSGQPIFPAGGTTLATCYRCHPGAITQCLRGAMASSGIECRQCHGDMLSVGGAFPLLAGGSIDGTNDGHARRPWTDVPRCQSCHTGDAVSHLTGSDLVMSPDLIRLRQAWRVGDASASPILAVNQRFAENAGKPYKASRGHGGLACESCHGSTHAEWPNADPAANDNVAAVQLQGHTGVLIECGTCHTGLPTTMLGPHGLHNVNSQNFVEHHENAWLTNPSSCRACHGANLLGTVLSRTAANRTFQIEDGGVVTMPKGTQVRCNHCHSMPH